MKYTDPDGREVWDENGSSCTITQNDTLWKITDNFNNEHGTNISCNDAARANGIENPDLIFTGDNLDFSSFVQGSNAGNSKLKGDTMIGVNLNFVGCIGLDISVGLVFDLDKNSQSGLFISGGFAAGVSAGISVFAGYTNGNFTDNNLVTGSIGVGTFGVNLGLADNGCITGSGGVSYGLDAGFNISKQHGIVIPFDTPAQRQHSMDRYYEHH